MKPRRLIVTMEITSAVTMKELSNPTLWRYVVGSIKDGIGTEVHQIQANVVKKKKLKEGK